MPANFTVVYPATGRHAWDITEGWSAALRELGMLRREFRPKGKWNTQILEDDDGLLKYLESNPQEYFLLLGFDWHSQPLHYGKLYAELRMRSDRNIAVIWEDYEVDDSLLDGLSKKMREAWIRGKCAFKMAITNHENNIRALQSISEGVSVHYIGFGIDENRFRSNLNPESGKINRAYFCGKINEWNNDRKGGPYALRRSILEHLERSKINLVKMESKQSDFDYIQNLIRSTVCLNLPSFSLSPTLRNYEALAAESLLVTWRSDSPQSMGELMKFPNVFLYDPHNFAEITKICRNLLQIDKSEYHRLTSLGSEQLYRLTHKSRIKRLVDLLGKHREAHDAWSKSEPRALVVDMVFLQVARNGIAYVWDSIIKSYLRKRRRLPLVLIQRTDSLLSKYDCRIIKASPVEWIHSPEDIATNIDYLLHEHGIKNYCFASSYYTFSARKPNLQVVHDMIPELLGGTEPVWKHKSEALRRSQSLVCVSRSTRNDLIGFNSDWANKAIVNLNGVPSSHLQVDINQDTVLSPYKEKLISSNFTMIIIGGRYGWRGYKNCAVVFKAFKDFLSRIPDNATSKIICISHNSKPEPEIQQLITNLPVYFMEATDSELAHIRQKTQCLLYPSAIEGFGMPILESIYSGMSVITSDILPHREAAGTFQSMVHFVKPFSRESFADAMYDCFNKVSSGTEDLRNSDLLKLQIRQISEERWSSFADILEKFGENYDKLHVNNAIYQTDIFAATMKSAFRHKSRSLPAHIASSWTIDKA